jgi:hypothetical protein
MIFAYDVGASLKAYLFCINCWDFKHDFFQTDPIMNQSYNNLLAFILI